VLQLTVAAVGAISLAWVIDERLLPVTGGLGFFVTAYLAFVVLYGVVCSLVLDRVGAVDRVVGVLVASAGAVMVAALGGIVIFTVVRGWEAVHHLNFFTQTTAFIGPEAALDKGGIVAAVIGTLEQVAISMVLSVPLGVATAVYLNEVNGTFASVVRTVVEAMTAIPTIVAGLFIYSLLVLQLGAERSGFAASLALSVSMLPVVTKTAEVVLRLVPGGLREASLALGATQWQTVRKVVLPTARPGLVTAVLLGVARVIGETSPVLIVAGSTNELNADPMHGPQVSLPLFVFNQARMPLDTAIARAFGAAVVLLTLVVTLFTLARMVGGRAPGHVSRREQRRLAARHRDAHQLDAQPLDDQSVDSPTLSEEDSR
jgi:phosphate transport system permease protein